MPQYSVLQPISHDGKPYKEGSTVNMPTEAAEPLLELKAIAPVGASTESTPPEEDPMIVTQQVSEEVEPVDPSVSKETEESVDPKKAPPSTARKQQQKGGEG